MKIHAVVWKEGKWFIAKALEVEVTSQGRTEKKSLENLKEALELYFEGQSSVDIIPVSNPKLHNIPLQVNA